MTLPEQVESLLDQAGAATVPTGVLLWFGDTDLPDGVDPSDPLSPAAWAATYLRLTGGDLGRALPPLEGIQARAAQPGQPVPLAIASIRFDHPTGDIVKAVTEAARTGTTAALPASLTDAISPAETTIVTALLAEQWHRPVPAYRGRTLQLQVLPELLITNSGNATLTDIAIDAGGGFVDVAPGGTITVEVGPGVSSLTLTVRCRSSAGVRHAACTLAISDDAVPPAPDETWQLRPASGNTGHAFVFRSGTGNAMHRPILIAEGWPGGYSSAQLAEALGQHGMLARLLANGHDVVVVGFDKGTDTVQSNAGVIVEAIHQTGKRTTDRLVVGGMSMGGLVSRYALVQMEHAGVDHGAAVYLSLDSPHGRGAYTTVVGQWLVNHFTPLSPAFAELKLLILSPSNLQFVGLIENEGVVAPHPLRAALLAELHEMGDYPKQLVKLAIACGRGTGSSDPASTEPVLVWHDDGLADITLLPMPAGSPATIACGSTLGVPNGAPPPLVVTSDVCWETVPGALDTLNETVTSVIASLGCPITTNFGVSTSMPTVSALDATVEPNDPIPPPGSGASPFDEYLCAATDQLHLQFTPEHVDWLIDRIERHQPVPVPTTKGATMTDGPPAPSFNPNDPSFIADPYPTLAWYRDHLPVAQLELVPGIAATTATWVFRDEDVRRVLTETDTFLKHVDMPPADPTQPPTPPSVFGTLGVLPPGLLSSDPPRHAVVRAAVEPSFTAAIAQAAELAEQAVAERLQQLAATRRFELVQDYALPVPATVLLQVLGLPGSHLPVLENWVQSVATAHNITMPLALQAYGGICAMAMRTYYDAMVEVNQGIQGSGMLGGVCQHIGRDLQLHDVQAVMSDMLVAGYLTTSHLISTGIRSLLSNPDQLALLRNDMSLLPKAIEEMLRFDPPAQLLDRVVAVPTTLGGVALDRGTHLVVAINSANHDPQRFTDPETFDITRDDTTQIGFGDGIHTCIGAPLARIVAPIAIKGLLTLEGLRLDGLAQWQPDPYLRGLVNLPVAYGP
ncbi:MAG: cytochrome P450 [Ilumatobacteraceae bacterium]